MKPQTITVTLEALQQAKQSAIVNAVIALSVALEKENPDLTRLNGGVAYISSATLRQLAHSISSEPDESPSPQERRCQHGLILYGHCMACGPQSVAHSDQIADLLRDLRERVNDSSPETVMQAYADGDLLTRIDSTLAAPQQASCITQPARVNGVRFMPGVSVNTVIEAAYRYAQYQPTEEEADAAATRLDLLMAAVHGRVPAGWRLVPESWLPDGDGQIPSCMSAAGARRLKVLADLDLTYYELDEVFRAMLAAAPKPQGGEA